MEADAEVRREAAATLHARTLEGSVDALEELDAQFDRRGPEPDERRSRRLTTEPYGSGCPWAVAGWTFAALDFAAIALVTLSLPAALVGVVVSRAFRIYSFRYHLSAVDAERRLLAVPLVVVLTAALVQGGWSWIHAAWQFCAALVALVAARGLGVVFVSALRRRHPRPVLVFGGGAMGMLLADTLTEHRGYGLVPVGFVSDVGVPATELPVIPLRRAAPAVADSGVRDVLCAFGPESDADDVRVLRALQRLRIRLAAMPRFFDMSTADDHIWGIPLQPVRTALPASRVRAATKRAIEFVLVAIAVVLASPVLVACAIAVKVSSPGPVFYRQRRVGADGHEFEILKFRSMRVDSDSSRSWTVEDDPRRTRVGAVLRRWGLDELPQLFNVLKGDMSLVGPRPEQPSYAGEFATEIPTYRDRERVRSGLTGFAQVYGLRGDTSIDERVRFDNRYIDRQSLLLDVFIMLKTISAIVRGHGSY
ncbi:MAG: sugar transferase [Acidimicrobiia bacterium]|nr:sugar transferase [Acidimicrobiia bacterium]